LAEIVGRIVGLFVGCTVVGLFVGGEVGLPDGGFVGGDVGSGVGLFVGCTVVGLFVGGGDGGFVGGDVGGGDTGPIGARPYVTVPVILMTSVPAPENAPLVLFPANILISEFDDMTSPNEPSVFQTRSPVCAMT